MAINPELQTFIHHLHVRRSLLDQPWMTKLQHLQTIQTCHCHRMPGKYGKVTSWHAAAFSDSAEPIPHTRPRPPRCQSGSLPNRCSSRTSLSSTPRPRPGNRDRSRLASSSRALRFKSWSLKSGEHMTFNSDMWISLIQNLANNAESDSCLQHLHIWQLSLRWKMNDETTAPPNHPNLSLSKDVGDMTSWHAAAFSDSAEPIPHTRPRPPRRQSGCIPNWFLWRTRLSSAPRPRPGNRDRSRLVLHPGLYPSNRDHWNPENTWHLTLTCESLWYRTLQTKQKSTVAYSIYIFDNPPWTEMNDETTGPPNHPNLSLSKDVENIWKQKHSAVGSTVKTWSLKSWEQYMQIWKKNM